MRIILYCLIVFVAACGDEQAPVDGASEAPDAHFLSEHEEALKKAKEAAQELENAAQKTKQKIDDAIDEAPTPD